MACLNQMQIMAQKDSEHIHTQAPQDVLSRIQNMLRKQKSRTISVSSSSVMRTVKGVSQLTSHYSKVNFSMAMASLEASM